LLFCVNKVNHLLFFNNIGPLHTKLLGLITSVYIVEDGELGSNQPSEVSSLDVTQIESEQELVMPDHISDPFVVGPSTKTRD
jgi:hypothetical protein